MSVLAKFALLAVVFVDLIGQGLVICLAGALIGYLITIVSLFLNSIWLLVLGRAITGFTAGNQPIAQAAMVDASRDDAEKGRNMGFIVAGISAGLVAGPIIGGILSDKSLIGDAASIKLPFYCAVGLVLITIILVQLFFRDVREPEKTLSIQPLEIFRSLWRIFDYPIVLRISLVFFFFQWANVTFYIFIDNYLTDRFEIGLFGTSMAMMVLGVALASSSTLLVTPVQKRFSKITIVGAMICAMIIWPLLYSLAPHPSYCYALIFVYYSGFGIAYPTILGIFSASVDDNEQGWVMGITVALFTLSAGITSFLGGKLTSIDIRSPFYVSCCAALAALALLYTTWNRPEIKRITL